MLEENTFLLYLHVGLAGVPGALGIQWNAVSNRLSVLGDASYKRRLAWKGCLHHLYTLGILFQTIHYIYNANLKTSLVTVMIVGNSAMLLFFSSVLFHSCIHQGDDLVCYLNGILQFADIYRSGSKRERRTLEMLNLAVSYAAFISGVFFPVAIVYGLHWGNPCKPSFFGYWLLFNECGYSQDKPKFATCGRFLCATKDLGYLALRSSVFFFNYCMWIMGFPVMTFVLGAIHILAVMSIRNALARFTLHCVLAKCSVRKMVTMYRHIQVLSRIGSVIGSGVNMTVFLTSAILHHSAASVVLIKMHWTLETLPAIAFFLALVMDTCCGIFICFAEIAGVYKESKRVSQGIQSKEFLWQYGVHERKYLYKFGKSLRVIRFCFGTTNFVEEVTPLNSIDFANVLIANLLLVGRKLNR